MTARKATATARPSAAQRSLAAKGKKAAAKKRSTLDSRSHRTLHPLPEDVHGSKMLIAGRGKGAPPPSRDLRQHLHRLRLLFVPHIRRGDFLQVLARRRRVVALEVGAGDEEPGVDDVLVLAET